MAIHVPMLLVRQQFFLDLDFHSWHRNDGQLYHFEWVLVLLGVWGIAIVLEDVGDGLVMVVAILVLKLT